jgi:hypothetical protein
VLGQSFTPRVAGQTSLQELVQIQAFGYDSPW